MKLILTLEDIIPSDNLRSVGEFLLKEEMRVPVVHAFFVVLAQRFIYNLTTDAVCGEGEFASYTFTPIRCAQLAVIIKRMYPMDSIIPIKMLAAGWDDFQADYFHYDKVTNALKMGDMLYQKDVVVGQVINGLANSIITVERSFSL